MVTFTAPNGKWHDEVRLHRLGVDDQSIACFPSRHSSEYLQDGEHAMAVLARRWKCEIEEITHDLPQEITTFSEELDFLWFHRGHGFAVRQADGSYIYLWADLKSDYCRKKDWDPYQETPDDYGSLFPHWKEVTLEVLFRARSEYVNQAVERIMNPEDHKIADGWNLVERDGLQYVHVDIWANHRFTFKVCEGEFREDGFHIRRLTGEEVHRVIPFPPDAKRALDIVAEEKNKAIKELMPKFFPTGTDVVMWSDFQDSILYGVDPIPHAESRYDVAWMRRYDHDGSVSALVVRIPKSGLIRCPEEYRGRLIGHKGVKINELAKKHGHRFLKII